jgi:broad specificity phosphatase PhoE
MRAIFVRHGESTGNAGLPCHDLSKLELTEKGREQARQIAEGWNEAPDLIVLSPYLRTHQTAQPTRDRFPHVPVQQWPIEEFTYLEPSRWNGTARSERLPRIEDYWNTVDPMYCDGPGAESFVSLLGRAEIALGRLRSLQDQAATVLLFTHGQFMQAVRMSVLYPAASNQDKMRSFWLDSGMPAFENAERFDLELLTKGWAIRSAQKTDRIVR